MRKTQNSLWDAWCIGIFIFTIFLLLAFPVNRYATGSNIYFAQNAVGGNTGADCADARAASTNSSSDDIPGNFLHLCGTFTGGAGATGLFVLQGGGSSGNPLTVVFETGTIFTATYWGGSGGNGGVIQDTGYNYVVIDGGTNGTITATANGTGLSNQQDSGTCVQMLGASNSEVKNLTCTNMYVHTGSGMDGVGGDTYGIYWAGGSNNTADGNVIHDMRGAIYYDYPGGQTTSNLSFHDNVISNITWGILVGDGSPNANLTGCLIYHNTIHDFANWDTGGPDDFHEDGIFVFGGQTGTTTTGLQIYNNYIYGAFSARGNQTAGIYVSYGPGTITTPLVFNNIVSVGSGTTDNGLLYFLGTSHMSAWNNDLVDIGGSTGIELESGSVATLENNILQGTALALYFADGSITLDASDYNVWYGNAGIVQIQAGAFYSTLAAWNSASGYDGHSKSATPNLVSWVPTATSSAIGNGTNLSPCTGHLPLCSDGLGNARPSSPTAWDIGARNSTSGGPVVSLSVTSHNFGGIAVGMSSSPFTITLTNTGSAALHITTVLLTTGTEFATSSDTCSSATVSVSSTCTIAVTFTPTTANPYSDTLSFTDDAPGSPQTVTVSGAGTSPGIPVLAGNSATAAYGSSFSLAYNGANTAGDLLAVIANMAGASSLPTSPTISDTAGNTYVQVVLDPNPTNSMGLIVIWVCYQAKAAATDTVTIAATGDDLASTSFTIAEFSGVNTLDQGAGATPGNSGTGTTWSSNTFTTSFANELLLGGAVCLHNTLGVTSPFLLLGSNEVYFAAFYQIVSSVQTGVAATGTCGAGSGSPTWGADMISLYENHASPPRAPVLILGGVN